MLRLHLALQLLNTEVGAELLGAGAVGVGQVLCIDAEAVGSVADTVALSSCQSSITKWDSIGDIRSCKRRES